MANYKTGKYEYVDCKPYKGYDISKSYALDVRGRRIPDTGKYMVSNSEDDWVGDVYDTLAEAHQFIDEELASTSITSSTNRKSTMRNVLATTGRSTSTAYIKSRLFDWMFDGFNGKPGYEIDGWPAQAVVERIENLAPQYDIDDVIDLAIDEGELITWAIEQLEDQIDNM